MSPWLLALQPLLALPLAAAPALPQDASQGSFEAKLEEARHLIDKRRWSRADRALQTLLRDHAGADYVRPHLPVLLDDVRRVAFWRDVDAPPPRDLISGELLRYSESNGGIRVRYTKETLDDFALPVFLHQPAVHPMHFAGPWSASFEGSADELRRLSLVVITGPSKGYIVTIGSAHKDFIYLRHTIKRFEGKDSELLAWGEPPDKAKPRKRSVRLTYDGKKVLEVDRPEGGYGQVGLLTGLSPKLSGDFETLTLEGPIDRGWISGLIDAALADQRAAFDAAWSTPATFEAWPVTAGEMARSRVALDLLESLTFERKVSSSDELAWIEVNLEAARGESSLELLQQLSDQTAMPEDLVAIVRYQCAITQGRPAQALAGLRELTASEGHELAYELQRARLLLESGRKRQAHEAFERLTETQSQLPYVFHRNARALLLLGRPEEALESLRRGLAKHPFEASLHELERIVLKAARGPTWNRTLEERSRHFVIQSDGDRKLLEDLAEVLEDAWERCEEFFGPLPEAVEPNTQIYLFSGQASYLDYIEEFADGSAENTLGVYNVLLKHIAAWNQPSRQLLYETLRHEVAHRYLDLAVGERLPRWLNEGLAEVFAAGWEEQGTYRPGRVHPRLLAGFATELPLPSLRQLVLGPPEVFFRNIELSYLQSWAYVHYLIYETEDGRTLLERFRQEIAAGDDPVAAAERLFPDTWDRTDEEYRSWAQGEAKRLLFGE